MYHCLPQASFNFWRWCCQKEIFELG